MVDPGLLELAGLVFPLLNELRHLTVVLSLESDSLFCVGLVSQFFDLSLGFLGL
jgi:hypothetical protein